MSFTMWFTMDNDSDVSYTSVEVSGSGASRCFCLSQMHSLSSLRIIVYLCLGASPSSKVAEFKF